MHVFYQVARGGSTVDHLFLYTSDHMIGDPTSEISDAHVSPCS